MTVEPSGKALRMAKTCEAALSPWQVARMGSECAVNISKSASRTRVETDVPTTKRAVDRSMAPTTDASDDHAALSAPAGGWPRVFPGL